MKEFTAAAQRKAAEIRRDFLRVSLRNLRASAVKIIIE
jgi:hypothetical protein